MNASDWLLPQPTGTVPTGGVLNADGSFNGPIFAEFVSMLADEVAVNWPAFAEDGSPVIPPDIHTLDHLSRAYDLVDENTQIDHPVKATTVRVQSGPLPECAFCDQPARYDGPVDTPEGGRFACMCVEDARRQVEYLGSTSGVCYLMRADEVPASIRNLVNSRLRELGREELFDEP